MKTDKIKAFEKKVYNEAKKAVNAVYKKHNKAMIKLIAQQIPKGKRMSCFNGMTMLEGKTGRAWGVEPGNNHTLNYLSSLQYLNKFDGGFDIPQTIIGQCTNIK